MQCQWLLLTGFGAAAADTAGGAGNVLAELLDLLDLAGQLGGEGLLQRLQLDLLAMDPGRQHVVGRAHTVVLEE